MNRFELHHGDCLEVMKSIPDGSVNMILCDLPYGTTDCEWDSVIDLDRLWLAYNRILRKNGVIALTATQPFSSLLVTSNIECFRYEWVWQKTKSTGFFNAKKQPLRQHETILIFYSRYGTYNPIMTEAHPDKIDRRKTLNTSVIKDGIYSRKGRACNTNMRKPDNGLRYPVSVQTFPGEYKKVHPTQKPVALMEYLIRTYTNEGETVLDNCMGSGTTGVACMNTGRRFIGIEMDAGYFQIAQDRIVGTAANENKAATGEQVA